MKTCFTRYDVTPRRCLRCVAVLACLALPSIAAAQPGRGAVDAGNRLYDEGRYEEAHEQYLEALRQAPDSTIVPFNDGNALYRTEELERAMESYRQAIDSENPAVEAQAWYNLGNALYKQQQLEPALEAYKEALRRNSADTDAKHNFELTLEQLEQQQQQQQQSPNQQTEQLIKLQKQIINATWRLRRQPATLAADAPVLLQSQKDALNKAKALLEKSTDEKTSEFIKAIIQHMETSVKKLTAAQGEPGAVNNQKEARP